MSSNCTGELVPISPEPASIPGGRDYITLAASTDLTYGGAVSQAGATSHAQAASATAGHAAAYWHHKLSQDTPCMALQVQPAACKIRYIARFAALMATLWHARLVAASLAGCVSLRHTMRGLLSRHTPRRQ